jgi:hypothetical protein
MAAAAAPGDGPGSPGLITTGLPDMSWQSFLSADNLVGREWLQNQMQIAQHLLTSDQINQMMAAFQMPIFPVDLAKLLAAKAAEASGLALGPMQLDASVADTCKNDTWSNCGMAVKRELDLKPANPRDVGELTAIWGAAFNAQFDSLLVRGHLEKSVPDEERMNEILNDHLNPLEIAKDHAKDWLINKCFRSLPLVLVIVNSPPVGVVNAYFENMPETATQYDELLLMDRVIEDEVENQLAPLIKTDWKPDLSAFVDRAAPKWTAPLP